MLDLTLPPVIDGALADGVLNGGVAFKTRRYRQLCYLVEFAAGFLPWPPEERRSLLDDPPGVPRNASIADAAPTRPRSAARCCTCSSRPSTCRSRLITRLRSEAAFTDLSRRAGDLDVDLRTI